MRWFADRVKGALNSWVERAILGALLLTALYAWHKRQTDVSVPVWLMFVVVVSLAGLALYLRSRRSEDGFPVYYADHLYDTLVSLQKVLRGAIPEVTIAAFIEQGMLQPAREFLIQRPDEDVRLSVLVPESDAWRMILAAGYRFESRQRFSLPLIGSFSRHAFESGDIEWSLDLEHDPRFTPHPRATRTYRSIVSVPITAGDAVVAVLNLDSTYRDAFSRADIIYVGLLGALIGVVWALGPYDPNAA